MVEPVAFNNTNNIAITKLVTDLNAENSFHE
jgi:hypothetical protein